MTGNNSTPNPTQTVVIHKDGHEVFDTSDVDSETITQYVDSLPTEGKYVALNTDISPTHDKIQLFEQIYPELPIRQTIAKYTTNDPEHTN